MPFICCLLSFKQADSPLIGTLRLGLTLKSSLDVTAKSKFRVVNWFYSPKDMKLSETYHHLMGTQSEERPLPCNQPGTRSMDTIKPEGLT